MVLSRPPTDAGAILLIASPMIIGGHRAVNGRAFAIIAAIRSLLYRLNRR